MNQRHYVIAVTVVATLVLVAGVGIATAGPSYYGQGGVEFDSIRVGRAGVGGVTFFNGTIVNETEWLPGYGNPVTFGDDVRIDGRIWNGDIQGSGFAPPVIIDDDLRVEGTIYQENDWGSIAKVVATSDDCEGDDILVANNRGTFSCHSLMDLISSHCDEGDIVVVRSGEFTCESPS